MPTNIAPTIDISSLFGSDANAKQKTAHEIFEACRGSGFFYASNHGIDAAKFYDVVNEFHSKMTNEEKFQLAINAYNKANSHIRNGYYMAIPGKKAVESYCYLNPSFNSQHPMIKQGAPMHEVNIWPDAAKHQRFQSFCEEHYRRMFHLSKVILRGMALALGCRENFFEREMRDEDTLSSVSLIRYPYIKEFGTKADAEKSVSVSSIALTQIRKLLSFCKYNDLTGLHMYADYPPVKTGPDGVKLSFEDHLDVSLITVLFQTPVQNLQVLMKDGLYHDIPTSFENPLINCGTYMSYITNDFFHAPHHRVKFVNAERLSLPFFVNLSNNSIIPPFNPGAKEEQEIPEKPPLSYGQYLQKGLFRLIETNGQT